MPALLAQGCQPLLLTLNCLDLGDAIFAAQRSYAETGLMPELPGVYHVLGDPATRIR